MRDKVDDLGDARVAVLVLVHVGEPQRGAAAVEDLAVDIGRHAGVVLHRPAGEALALGRLEIGVGDVHDVRLVHQRAIAHDEGRALRQHALEVIAVGRVAHDDRDDVEPGGVRCRAQRVGAFGRDVVGEGDTGVAGRGGLGQAGDDPVDLGHVVHRPPDEHPAVGHLGRAKLRRPRPRHHQTQQTAHNEQSAHGALRCPERSSRGERSSRRCVLQCGREGVRGGLVGR